MKRLKFWWAGVFFVALVAAMAVNMNLKYGATADSRDFTLTNVEALAQGEGGLEQDCVGSGSLLCDGSYHKVRVTR